MNQGTLQSIQNYLALLSLSFEPSRWNVTQVNVIKYLKVLTNPNNVCNHENTTFTRHFGSITFGEILNEQINLIFCRLCLVHFWTK